MAATLKITQPARRWHNHLPEGIVASQEYSSLRATERQVLQAIADACDAPERDGALHGAFGGQRLVAAAGVHRATFWRAIQSLSQRGLVYCQARGGTVDGRQLGNVYAIPAVPHGGQGIPREIVRYVTGADGRRRREVIRRGEQPALPFRGPPGAVAVCDYPSRSVRLPQSQCATPPSPTPSPLDQRDHGVAGQRRNVVGHRRRKLVGISVDELRDWGQIHARWREACKLRLGDPSDYGRLCFLAMAAHACRLGTKPAALFASNVNEGRWFVLAERDLDAANEWIRAAGARRSEQEA